MPTLPALLALADGSLFHGVSIGADGITTGEVVFNTAMTGYQEILTDPSYSRQIVTLTYPHIGNTGCNDDDVESTAVHAAGLIVRSATRHSDQWRATMSLPDYLHKHGIVGIAEIDTRRLTRILREKGAQSGCLMAGEVDETAALAAARAFPGLKGMDLAERRSQLAHARSLLEGSGMKWTLQQMNEVEAELGEAARAPRLGA